MSIVLDKSKINIDKYRNIKLNSTFWFIISFLFFLVSLIFLLSNMYKIYELKKDINTFYDFEHNSLPIIRDMLKKDFDFNILSDYSFQLINIRNTLPNISSIYTAIVNSYNKNQILLKSIVRNGNVLNINGASNNIQQFSITSVMKFIETLKTYDFFDTFYLNIVDKNISNNASISDFNFNIHLKPTLQLVKTYTAGDIISSVNLYNFDKPKLISNLRYDIYTINDKNIIDIKWDYDIDDNFKAFLIYKGDYSTNLNLYDIVYKNNYVYTTLDKNKNYVFQIFVLDKNFNLSDGSQIINVNTYSMTNYLQINPIKISNEKIKNKNNILLNVFNISWDYANILPNKEYIILYSVDNKKYYIAGKTKNTSYQFTTPDISNNYYFNVVYQK